MTTKIKTFGGNIGIGTTDPGDFKLNVHGSLKTNSLVVNGVTNAQVPIGLIAPWYGSLGSIPSGWKLCDGSTYTRTDGGGNITTPNLTARFIRGATGDAPSPVAKGTTGGSNNASLSVANLASHSHGVSVSQGNANHSHGGSETSQNHTHGGNSNYSNAPHNHENAPQTSINHSHGGDSNYSNAPHTHNTGNNEALHYHQGELGLAPHYHNIRALGPNIATEPGTYGQFLGPNPIFFPATSYSNGPHNHGRTNATQAPHGHGPSGNNSAPHTHGIAEANTPHSHDTNYSNAPHTHSTPQVNANHSHPVTAVNAPHGHNASSNNTGQGTAFSVLNAYYALFYIMKI
jgi:hypothetical protein